MRRCSLPALAAGAVLSLAPAWPALALPIAPQDRAPALPAQDLWRVGERPADPATAAVRGGWPRLGFTGRRIGRAARSDAERILARLTGSEATRNEEAEMRLERTALPGAAPLNRDLADDLRRPLPPGSAGGRLPPLSDRLRPEPGAPPLPWEVQAPSLMFEVQRTAPPDLAAQARFGLRDPIRGGLAARVLPGGATPDWAGALAATAHEGARRPRPGPAVPASPDDAEGARALRLFVGLLAGAAVLAAATLLWLVNRRNPAMPPKLRSRRFG